MLNKCTFIGNLGQKPELKQTANGKPWTRLSVGVTESWKNANGEKQTETEWVSVSVFGLQAENVVKYLDKGRQVYVEGKMKTDSYEKDGVKKYSTNIVANNVLFLGGANDKAPTSQPTNDNFSVPF